MRGRYRSRLIMSVVLALPLVCAVAPPGFARAAPIAFLGEQAHPTVRDHVSADRPAAPLAIEGTLFFTAEDGIHGRELWRSDGTEAGTAMVKDVRPGIEAGVARDLGSLTNVGGTLYFVADDGTNGYELWRSDGTEAGTVMVKDIRPGRPEPSLDYYGPYNLTDVGGTLYFGADDGTHGFELWKSDGTAAGTVMLKDIWPGPDASYAGLFSLTGLRGSAYFGADDGTHGDELWKSNGTAAGTVMVKDIWPGSKGSRPSLTKAGLRLFLLAWDRKHGYELWKSDGTAAGTRLVKDINPGLDGSNGGNGGQEVTSAGGVLYFTADGHDTPYDEWVDELWRSDGTRAGTVLVKDLEPCCPGSYTGSFVLVPVGDVLYFNANDPDDSRLWKTDGTPAGTVMVKNIEAYPLSGAAGTLFLLGRGGLWKSDGTRAGTVLVKHINIEIYANLGDAGGVLHFQGRDGIHGAELWKSDGTKAGTMMVKDINLGSASSLPDDFFVPM